MAGGAELPKDVLSGRRTRRLRLVERAHRGKDPQRLRIEGIAPALGNAVVINGRVGECVRARWHVVHFNEALPGVELVAGEAATPLVNARIGVEVGIAAADCAPIHQFLIGWVLFREHGVQRSGLAWPGAENMGSPVGQPV